MTKQMLELVSVVAGRRFVAQVWKLSENSVASAKWISELHLCLHLCLCLRLSPQGVTCLRELVMKGEGWRTK